MFAVIQDGFAIMGIGETAALAIADASEREPVGEVSDSYDAVHGAMYVLPCSSEVTAAVEEEGGAALFYVDGRGRRARVELE